MAGTTENGAVDLYDTTYAKFQERVRGQIRRETYGEDIVQNSWLTADEFREFFDWMELSPSSTVLEVAVVGLTSQDAQAVRGTHLVMEPAE